MSRSLQDLILTAATTLTNAQADTGRLIIGNTTALAFTLTLPPAPNDGQDVYFKRIGATNPLTIAANALPVGNTIDGFSDVVLTDPNQTLHLRYDATLNRWNILNPDLGANVLVTPFAAPANLTTSQSSRGAVNIADTGGGAFTLTLPAAPTSGDHCYFKNIGAALADLTVDGNGNNIDGAATLVVADGLTAHIAFDGTVWRTLGAVD